VLIVEDAELLRTSLAKSLEAAGFQVMVAENQDEARALALKHTPDITLLDILLPGEDGFLLLKEFLANPSFKGKPIIVITNVADPEWRKKCLELGAAEYLVKADYRLDQLIAKVEEVCRRHCGS
jgi:DNA-binding response OmpR family regulator